MRKLLRGIAEFRRLRRPDYAETFARLALGQRPDALFIGCSDSRVMPNLFASTEPGDLFVIRNVGNVVPPAGPDGRTRSDESEGAAIELAIRTLEVRDVIVCGHSECVATRLALGGAPAEGYPNLVAWLRHIQPGASSVSLARDDDEAPHNQLSRENALRQVEHLRTYPDVRRAEAAGRLKLHAWWFDIAGADLYAWDATEGRYLLLDESRIARLLGTLPVGSVPESEA